MENPESSLLTLVEPLQSAMVLQGVTKEEKQIVTTDHAYFDNDLNCPVKTLKLIGTAPYMSSLIRRVPRKQQREQLSECVDGRVFGKKDVFSDSAHYSLAFGRFIADTHLEWLRR